MVKLADQDIRTREVLDWRGVNLLHAHGSSCSQKTRIFLNLKNIVWESHLIDLTSGENHRPWYLGINPRGLVPCLVHDGVVHIESNDIIEYLEATFPEPKLFPRQRSKVSEWLQREDDLHLDLRTLTFRYLIPTKPGQLKSTAALEQLRQHPGTIGGREDAEKLRQIEFWESANRQGITDQQVAQSVNRFQSALAEFDRALQSSRYLLGEQLTVIDIAWYVYTARLLAAGYPLREQHEYVGAWFDQLDRRPEFHREVQLPPPLRAASQSLQRRQAEQGRSMASIGGL